MSAESSMDLNIESLTGTNFELRVSPFETVISIKAKIQRMEGIPISQQHLIWNTRELEDDLSLHDYSISDGCTLKLVLSMRGGPINTRRVPMEDPSLQEVADFMEANRDDLLDKIPANRQVTLLVFRDGDQLNFFRVVDRGDGTLTPLSETLSGTSVYNLYEDDDDQVDAYSQEQAHENNVTMRKMESIRNRLEHLSVHKRGKQCSKLKVKSPTIPGVNKMRTLRQPTYQLPPSHHHQQAPRPPHRAQQTPASTLMAPGATISDHHGRSLNPNVPLPPVGSSRGGVAATDGPLEPDAVLDAAEEILQLAAAGPSSSSSNSNVSSVAAPAPSNATKLRRARTSLDRASMAETALERSLKPLPKLGASSISRQQAAPHPPPENGPQPTAPPGAKQTAKRRRANGPKETNIQMMPLVSSDIEEMLLSKDARMVSRQEARVMTELLNKAQQDGKINTILCNGNSKEVIAGSGSMLKSPSFLQSTSKSPSQRTLAQSEQNTGSSDVLTPEGPKSLLSARGSRARRLTNFPSPSHQVPIIPKPPGPAKPASRKKRCFVCNKKTGLATSYQCRCGSNFCASHRYAESHDCSFDYKAAGRKILTENNPVVNAPKLPKI